MSNRPYNERRYPIDASPFEAFYDGSWWNVECIRIREGTITMPVEYHSLKIEEKIRFKHIRIRSRRANMSDCSCYLRPGVDICVHLTDPSEAASDEVWIDAKIDSIERTRHESQCTCRFYVSFDAVDHPFVAKDVLEGGIKEVTINDIAILQQLERNPCEEGCFRWISSKNCLSRTETKLSRAKIANDMSWMLIASSLKGVVFRIRSLHNKIVYEVLQNVTDSNSLHCVKILKIINFRKDNDRPMIPFTSTFDLEGAFNVDDTEEMGLHKDLNENVISRAPLDQFVQLRRSERRRVQPERFGSLECPSWDKPLPIQTDKKQWKLVVASEDTFSLNDFDYLLESSCFKPEIGGGEEYYITDSNFKFTDREIDATSEKSVLASGMVQSSPNFQLESCVPLLLTDKPHNDSVPGKEKPAASFRNKEKRAANFGNKEKPAENSGIKEKPAANFESHLNNIKRWLSATDTTPHWVKARKRQRWSFENRSAEWHSSKRMRSGQPFSSKLGNSYWTTPARSVSEYNEIIKGCMKKIRAEIDKGKPSAVSQKEKVHAEFPFDEMILCPEEPTNNQEEDPELETLWKEMETAMTEVQYIKQNQNNASENSDKVNGSNTVGRSCEHEFKLNEEIGLVCQLCGIVGSEIRHILPYFLQNIAKVKGNERCAKTALQNLYNDDLHLDLPLNPSSSNGLSLQEENVWAQIPELRNKLHAHQKKAFEFLWNNIAGSMVPTDMEANKGRKTGCVISHSPGSGKTLLVISFLVSYLRLFPGKRPLILAPKTTLFAWYKEFKKWEVPFPLYQIHTRRNFSKELRNKNVEQALEEYKVNQDVMHVIDCLEKIHKWHKHPSILLIGYPAFLSLMRDSKFEHRRYMAKILKKSPKLLVLDEGHNPRSTLSMLRKTLMEVKTAQRILLSGTLFQNNFEEYFNTLSLARPYFIDEVLKKLGPGADRDSDSKENRKANERLARKFFIDKIAIRINSEVDRERRKGLKILRKLTDGFIDVYEGGTSDTLRSLHGYTVLINPTEMQKDLLGRTQLRATCNKVRLELELLVTIVAIHPWLTTTLSYADKYYGIDELVEFEKHKSDVTKGSKGEQVLELHGELELYDRAKIIDKFEIPHGPSQVLLASMAACSEGISLTAASRVVLLDSEWNPSKTKQAVARAFRPGQERDVFVYQLLASGTMEEGKYDKNMWKDRMSRMIFVGEGLADSSFRQIDNIDDDILRGMVAEDEAKIFHMIMKDEKLSNGFVKEKEAQLFSKE
ncbi:hypothetical protein Scep_002462 [Stephania cephalantha]|uniref:Uncharacterized protein n=1 Tax=Stephania cephalantha TaxID=152367 RepID=A0AAP0LA80_9MAGN